MSEESVELARRIYDAWDREESARDFLAEDVEYVNPSYAVEPGIRKGRGSFRVVRTARPTRPPGCRRRNNFAAPA